MKNIKKYIIVSAAFATAVAIFAVLMILYDKGLFDISFIKRGTQDVNIFTEPATETETETETADATDTDEPEDTGAETTDEGEVTADQSVFDELHETVPTTNGITHAATEDTYDENTMALYRLDVGAMKLPQTAFSGEYMSRTRYFAIRDTILRKINEYTSAEARRSVDVYMGLIVVSDGKTLSFYNPAGIIQMQYRGPDELVFAYERDAEDRPLFILNGVYYYIDGNAKVLRESDFDKKDSRGLNYNYPTTFGKDAEKANFKNYYEVVFKDESGIGSVYFDGGYVMVRNIKHERDNDDRKVVEDMEIIVNREGKEFSLPEGYTAKAYSDQRILVENNGKYGFFAVKGAWIADAKYTYATPYYEGLAVVGNSGQKGVIDLDGNFVIPMSYSHISVCSGGIIVCWSNQTGYEIYIKAEK